MKGYVCMSILVRWCWLWKQKSSHERNKCLEKNGFRENTKTCPIIQWFPSATEDAIVSPVISTVNVCGRCNKKSTAMKDSWRLVVVDGPLIVSAECHKNWYRTFQEILKIWVCRKWEFQSRPATAIDHQCSCLTTFPLPICTHKLLLAQSKGTATWDRYSGAFQIVEKKHWKCTNLWQIYGGFEQTMAVA
jgi:hypothetical protein